MTSTEMVAATATVRVTVASRRWEDLFFALRHDRTYSRLLAQVTCAVCCRCFCRRWHHVREWVIETAISEARTLVLAWSFSAAACGELRQPKSQFHRHQSRWVAQAWSKRAGGRRRGGWVTYLPPLDQSKTPSQVQQLQSLCLPLQPLQSADCLSTNCFVLQPVASVAALGHALRVQDPRCHQNACQCQYPLVSQRHQQHQPASPRHWQHQRVSLRYGLQHGHPLVKEHACSRQCSLQWPACLPPRGAPRTLAGVCGSPQAPHPLIESSSQSIQLQWPRERRVGQAAPRGGDRRATSLQPLQRARPLTLQQAVLMLASRLPAVSVGKEGGISSRLCVRVSEAQSTPHS